MKRFPYITLCVLLCSFSVLTACTSFTTVKEGTTQQRYFAAKQDYATMLTVVEAYVSNCRRVPTKTCIERSEQAQQVDTKLFLMFKAGDAAITSKEDERLAGYLQAIAIGLVELQAYTLATIK